MELYREAPRSYGRTRVERNDNQRRHIALGGFAVEYLLFKAGRLVKQDGQVPTEKEFIDFAIDNASDDCISYFGGNFCGPDGRWPVELDREFMNQAIGRANNQMRFWQRESLMKMRAGESQICRSCRALPLGWAHVHAADCRAA